MLDSLTAASLSAAHTLMPLRLPLLGAAEAKQVIAWRQGQAISAGQFLWQAQCLAAALPSAPHALNLCHDRYCFALALAAATLRGVVTLLPSMRTAAVIEQLQQQSPQLFALVDNAAAAPNHVAEQALPSPRPQVPEVAVAPYSQSSAGTTAWPPPCLDTQQVVARMYSSGSTGVPQAHDKTWGSLAANGNAQWMRLTEALPALRNSGAALVGTVPPQHSYGFESTLLLALLGHAQLTAERPFYPADIAAALALAPRPRVLVTTPFHLRNLLQSQVALPALDLILCATAPLAIELAQQAECTWSAPLLEIYGATETGQLATRRPTQTSETKGAVWRPYRDVVIYLDPQGQAWAQGGHVAQPTALADRLELLDPPSLARAGHLLPTTNQTATTQGFRLLDRHADMVNIAGKRSSLAYLTQVLCGLPGVQDGAYFQLEDDGDPVNAGVQRLAAAVVAPGLSAADLRAQLRLHIDPVFLPRPLLLLEVLPRNESSKLPVAALRALARSAMQPAAMQQAASERPA